MMEIGSKTNLLDMEYFIIKILTALINPLIMKILIMCNNCGLNMKENFQKIVKTGKGFYIYQMVNILRVIL